MKKLFPLLLLLLPAFTLSTYQTQRIRWDSFGPSGTPATTNASFAGTFIGSSSPGGSVSYGQALWRTGGISCRSSSVGTTDGGTNDLWMKVVHEDAGIDCECDMGSSSCTANSTTDVVCDCPAGMVQLAGSQWTVRVSSSTTCLTNPTSMVCSVDLFR